MSPIQNSTPEQLRFPPVEGLSVRGHFDGGALSSDFGPVILRGVDGQIGLTQRLAAAFDDRRHPSYIRHPLRDLFAQRIYQIACAYEDGNDANSLRSDPMFKLGLNHKPLDEGNDLASAPTFSRLENSATGKDHYRLARAFIDQFISSYAKPPKVIVLDMDHTDDPTHGQQTFSFYNAYYGGYCFMPLLIFEGISGKFITAVLRPGKRPTGAENAMIVKRVLEYLRKAWPNTHIVLRGDGHFANPELMQLALNDHHCDFIFGLTANNVLSSLAEPYLKVNRQRLETHQKTLRINGLSSSDGVRSYHEFEYAAGTWPRSFRVIVKAEVNNQGDNPRYVVTSLKRSSPKQIYQDLYCARGQDENYIKALKNDLASDRTSNHDFLANHMRLWFSCAAYVLHHTLRTEVLKHTELGLAQPSTVILKLFKIAVRVLQYKDRIKLQLPTQYPLKKLLHQVCEILFLANRPLPAPS